jgi:hypothetical protein
MAEFPDFNARPTRFIRVSTPTRDPGRNPLGRGVALVREMTDEEVEAHDRAVRQAEGERLKAFWNNELATPWSPPEPHVELYPGWVRALALFGAPLVLWFLILWFLFA